jgi:glycosyltransferase involved in cell wall biosynthesis
VLSTNESFGAVATGRGRKRGCDVYVVRNGPMLADLDAVRNDARIRLSRGSRFLIVYVGMMGAQDGVSILLDAVRELAEQRLERDFRLALFGDGPELRRLRGLANTLGVDELVDFHGRVSFEEVLSAISASDVCVCPDPKTPMNDLSTLVKVAEYLGIGRPVVAFDLRETRRTAGDAAVYAEPNSVPGFASAIDGLLKDADLRRTLGERGRERVRSRFTWEYSQRELLRAYGSLFNGREQ